MASPQPAAQTATEAAATEPAIAPVSIFQNFDESDVFIKVEREAASLDSKNFVLEFGPDSARVAQNLDAQAFGQLLQSSTRDPKCPIRWINIWDTSSQKEAIDEIGSAYHFSNRLMSLMKYATEMAQVAKDKGAEREETIRRELSQAQQAEAHHGHHVHHADDDEDDDEDDEDLEKGLTPDSSSYTSRPLPTNALVGGEDIELYAMLRDTVNYSSIDKTSKALCIGAHWLHRRPGVIPKKSRKHHLTIMPPKHWIWIVMCNDNTVLSFHDYPTVEEAPQGASKAEAEAWVAESLSSMRSNTLNVLLQQSKKGFGLFERDPISQNRIRKDLKDRSRRYHSGISPEIQMQELGEEGASNLFYYLFEDYAAAQPLKSADRILEELTPIVLQSDGRNMQRKLAGVIPQLHHLSKDLRELKHLFENYRNLIDKILKKTNNSQDNNNHTHNSHHHHHGGGSNNDHWDPMSRSYSNFSDIATTANNPATTAVDSSGSSDENFLTAPINRPISLTPTSRDRFDRLGDRLQWLMLNTIQGHLEEIAALSDTYFNLTQQKDSRATAKLNSSATLLAKLSVFFLPISFLTSYFSVQIEPLFKYWTAEDYWYSFAVIATISFLGLFFFGRLLMFVVDTLDESAASTLHWFGERGKGVRLFFRGLRRERRRSRRNKRKGKGKEEGGGGGGEEGQQRQQQTERRVVAAAAAANGDVVQQIPMQTYSSGGRRGRGSSS